ncbi:putative quinol monooxygenase [Cognatishimia sp. WU-CL00825]|uniref:putative quinol monooxygenase n=1 Tax=Cognatishimia sp. WU-CL00825 TaxID=3127658 RepID=UPI003107C32B
MYVVTVTFTLHPSASGDFMPLMLQNAQTSLREEPGCLVFDVCRGNDPNTVFLYEIYKDRAAFDTHLQSDHFQSFDAAVQSMIAEKTIKLFHEVHR